MVPRLEDEDHDKSKNNEQKKDDVLPPASVLLVPSGDIKLLYGLAHVDARLLDVVFDTVEECALVYDE